MKTKSILGLTFLLLFALDGFPSSPVSPYSYVISHPGADYFFVMTPAKSIDEGSQPIGRCYQISPKGDFVTTWTTSGWWAFPSDVFLSPEGDGLVRILDVKYAVDADDNFTIGAVPLIRFYKNGKVAKDVSVQDMIDIGAIPNNDYLKTLGEPLQIIWTKEEFRTSVPRLYSKREAQILGPLVADRAAYAALLLEIKDDESVFVCDTISSERFIFAVPSGRLLLRKKIAEPEKNKWK